MITINKLYFYLVIALTIVGTMLGVDLPGDSLLTQELQNTGHTFSSGILAIIILQIIKHLPNYKNTFKFHAYFLAIIFCFIVGVLIEAFQYLLNKDADTGDVLRNVAGIISFLGISYGLEVHYQINSYENNKAKFLGIIIGSAIVLFAALLPLTNLTIAYLKRDHCFPVILDFNKGCGEYFVALQHAQLNIVDNPSEDTFKAKILFHRDYQYPGIELIEPKPNWLGYSNLYYEIYSDEHKPFELVVRIHDKDHNFQFKDRYNRLLEIKPGINLIRIPLVDVQFAPTGREMDMSAIDSVIWFVERPEKDLQFQFRKAWLE